MTEICQHLFPDIPKSTVRNWCRTLEISTVTCEPAERLCFRERNPSLGGTFGLIRGQELERLIDFRANKRARCTPSSSTETITTASNTIRSPTTNAQNVPRCSKDIVPYSESSDEGEAASIPIQDLPNESPSDPLNESTSEIQSNTESDTKKPQDTKKRVQLPIEDCSDHLKDEMKQLLKFYERPLNPQRCGPPFAQATLDKLKERAMCYFYYCKNLRNIVDLKLSLFSDTKLYTDYLEYLKEQRKLKPSTLVAHIIIAINIVKFNLAQSNCTSMSPGFSPAIQALQSFQRQFHREASMLAKRSREGLTKKSSKQFYFAHVLETLRSLRDKYFESTGLAKNRFLHNFVLLATFVRGLPGRSKELRTMRLFDECEKKVPFDYTTVDSGNFILFHEDERVVVVQFDFKTSKTAGPTKIDLSSDQDLIYYLKLYLKVRTSLLLGKNHDYFFCNRHGDPFASSGTIAKYLGDIFEREVSIRASTTTLRHSIVTYFNSLEDSNDISIRKSLAFLMKHSVRYQESVYNDQTSDERTKAARQVIREKIAQNVFGDIGDISNCSDRQNSPTNTSDSEDDFELLPMAGDICALLDSCSTKDNVEFFLAKIARYTQDKSEVHLIHMERLEDHENLYRLKPGRAWTESLKSIIFPVDCVWNQTSNAYELRTLPKDIFKAVHGNA